MNENLTNLPSQFKIVKYLKAALKVMQYGNMLSFPVYKISDAKLVFLLKGGSGTPGNPLIWKQSTSTISRHSTCKILCSEISIKEAQ